MGVEPEKADNDLPCSQNSIRVDQALQLATSPASGETRSKHWLQLVRTWRKDNWRDIVAILGTVGTLFFGGLSVYYYQAAKIKPALTFAVHPLKTELQRPEFDKALGFTYDGRPVESESITAVQVSIWNAGTQPIRESQVLDTVRLKTPVAAPILSARVKKSSREICDVQCVSSADRFQAGVCQVTWRILEPGDGAVIQIIYAGGAQHDPTLEGTIEGQSNGIVVEKYALNPQTRAIEATTIAMEWIGPILLLIALAVAVIIVALRIDRGSEAARQISKERKEVRQKLAELDKLARRHTRPIAAMFMALALMILVVAFGLLFWSHASPGPPFGW